jgi:Na+/H+-dicarboxylate symporter
MKKYRSIEIPLTTEHYETADQFIEQWMKESRISETVILENKLVFEAIFHDIIAQGFGEETALTIKLQRIFGEYCIKLGFEGKSYVPAEEETDDVSPELRIVQAYNDKVGYRYRMGYNSIRITVKRNYRSSLIYCLIGIVLAILVYLPISSRISPGEQVELDHFIIRPLIRQFANAMLMVGAPVTLFSLVKNLTDIYIVSEKSSSGRQLQIKTIVTSLIAVVLAFITGIIIAIHVSDQRGLLAGQITPSGGMTLSEIISSLVPSNIIEPFETYLPFPIILVALLVTYAFCSVGKYFDVMQKAVAVCFTLFSRMLNIVMFTLPLFCFLAILAALLSAGFASLLMLAEYVLLIVAGLSVLFIFYLIRLLIGRVKLGPFLRHLPMLIWENFKINSAIDAVPFNIRYCARKYGYNRRMLSEKLPILAETNQDGNCFLIMLISMIFIFLLGIDVSWFHIAGIAILILFLSFGAPNQPGSIMIGMLIITFFLQAYELVSIAIFAEVLFGALQNNVNVIGDIVTVAIEEEKRKRTVRA